MKRIFYTLLAIAARVTGVAGRVFHRKGDGGTTWNDGFNYVHPYDPFYKGKKKKRTQEVKLDEYEMSAFHDGR